MPEIEPREGPTAAQDRPALPARRLALASALGALVLVLVAVLAYHQLIRYERRAIEHVPAGSELALRIDLEQLVSFEPIRRHVLPLVDRAPLAVAGAAPSGVPRLVRLREEAGLNLALDLRELVFARVPGGSWVLALGGMFGSRRLLDGIQAVLSKEPGLELRRDGPMLIVESAALALAQADDGVLLLGNDARLLERALPASRGYAELALESGGAGALAFLPSWVEAIATRAGSSIGAPWRRSSARVDFGDPLELTLSIHGAASADPETLRATIAGWFGIPAEQGFVPRADWGGERAVLARARFNRAADALTRVTSTWERAEFARAARSLAAWIEGRFEASRPTSQEPSSTHRDHVGP